MPGFRRRMLNELGECEDILEAGVYVPPESGGSGERAVHVLLTDSGAVAGEEQPRRPHLVEVCFDAAYPMVPPMLRLASPIQHELVADDGSVHPSVLGAWVPSMRLGEVLLRLRTALAQDPSSPPPTPASTTGLKPLALESVAWEWLPRLLLLLVRAAWQARRLPEGWRYLHGIRGFVADLPDGASLRATAWRELRALLGPTAGAPMAGSRVWDAEASALRLLLRPRLDRWASVRLLEAANSRGHNVGPLGDCWPHLREFLPSSRDEASQDGDLDPADLLGELLDLGAALPVNRICEASRPGGKHCGDRASASLGGG